MESDRDYIELLTRIAVALERVAEFVSPTPRTRGPATLGTAAYTPEEKEKQRIARQWREAQEGSPRGASGPSRSDI